MNGISSRVSQSDSVKINRFFQKQSNRRCDHDNQSYWHILCSTFKLKNGGSFCQSLEKQVGISKMVPILPDLSSQLDQETLIVNQAQIIYSSANFWTCGVVNNKTSFMPGID